MSSTKSNITKTIINVTPELIAKAKGNATEAIYKALRAAGFKRPEFEGTTLFFNRSHREDINATMPKKVTKFIQRFNAVAANPKLKKPTSLSFVLLWDYTTGEYIG